MLLSFSFLFRHESINQSETGTGGPKSFAKLYPSGRYNLTTPCYLTLFDIALPFAQNKFDACFTTQKQYTADNAFYQILKYHFFNKIFQFAFIGLNMWKTLVKTFNLNNFHTV